MKKGLLSVIAGGALVYLGAKKMFTKDVEEFEDADVETVEENESEDGEESEEE